MHFLAVRLACRNIYYSRPPHYSQSENHYILRMFTCKSCSFIFLDAAFQFLPQYLVLGQRSSEVNDLHRRKSNTLILLTLL